VLVRDDNELFKFPWLPMQAIQSPDQDTIHRPLLDVAQQSLVLRTRLAGVEGAPVVIDVDAYHEPMSPNRFGTTVILLALNSETLA
jgi:hypothetical protein